MMWTLRKLNSPNYSSAKLKRIIVKRFLKILKKKKIPKFLEKIFKRFEGHFEKPRSKIAFWLILEACVVTFRGQSSSLEIG